MHLNAARAGEAEVFKHDVLQRADAGARIVVAAEFEIGLVVELEVADVGDVAQGDVVDAAIERGAVTEALHSGEQADGIGAVFASDAPVMCSMVR